MTGYKKTKPLNIEETAYIAGLIDGKGTVTLSRRHANENRHLVISIANTERALLEFVLGKITNKRVSSNKHTPSFCYAVENRQALSFLEQIFPYLRSYKRQRAIAILSEYETLTPRNGKYSMALLQRRADFERKILSLRPS